MAAFPFGGHPTLAQYITWARENGCRAQSGILSDEDGRVHTTTPIIGPSEKWVTIVGVRHDEPLVPTVIGNLDRRLGLTSPFFSVDAPDLE